MKKRRWIRTLLAIAYVGFIFSNSMAPADESSRQSGAVMTMLLKLLGSLGLEGGWVTEHLIRKTAHFAEYAVLGVLLWNCLGAYGAGDGASRGKPENAALTGESLAEVKKRTRQRLLCQGWLGTLIPLADETIQLFTEGRSGQLSDVWLDMAGVLSGTCGVILAAGIVGRWFPGGRAEKQRT